METGIWLTVEQATAYLNVSVSTLRRWRYERRGPAYARMSRSRGVRYSVQAIDSWLREREIASRPRVKRIDRRGSNAALRHLDATNYGGLGAR